MTADSPPRNERATLADDARGLSGLKPTAWPETPLFTAENITQSPTLPERLCTPRTCLRTMRTWEEATLDESFPLERLQKVFQEHAIQLAILFGSHANGEVHSRSGLDIAVELEDVQPADPDYNERFFGLSADLSETLDTDDIDLVDLQTASPELAATIFDRGILLVGDPEHATALRDQLTATETSTQSPRERFDAALNRIDEHLSGSTVIATDGKTRNE